jgi:hypothetical protein
MLGWQIIIYRTDLSEQPTDPDAYTKWSDECFLASWMTGIGGTDWLEELVTRGKATDLTQIGSYPDIFSSSADVILPEIGAGPPEGKNPLVIGDDYVMPKNWSGKIKVNESVLKACKPEDKLLIHAWDQS